MKTFIIRGEKFYYEKDVDGEDPSNYTYELYDAEGRYIASAIINFQGVREIAKAYLKSEKELEEAINEWCF